MVIRKQISGQNLLYGFFFAFIFVFLDRTLQISHVAGSGWFAWISRIVALMMVLAAIISCKRFLRKNVNIISLLITIIFLGYSLVTTILNSKSVYTAIASAYPILGMSLFFVLIFFSARNCKVFISAVANLYIILVTINLICIILLPNLFGDRYFLGIENQIGYTLIIGELFVCLDSELRQVNKKKIYYHLVCAVTLLLIFSGSNMVGLFVFVAYFLIAPFQKFVKRHSIGWFIVAYCIIFISVVIIDSNDILQTPVVRFIIEDVLGKNVTLTSRTYIWEIAVDLFLQKPWLGHGIAETTDVFYVYKEFSDRISINGSYSAHNQLLQSLYEVGVLGVGIIVLLIIWSDKSLSNCKNNNIVGVFRISIMATLIMMLAEAPGLYPLILVLNLAALFPRMFEKNNGVMQNTKILLTCRKEREFYG